ncbi:hypothetical protein BDV27DRAFT_164846 [Aspergillus caelatus]|uniref:Uncharacterized protein n=2 Tax=Aspergillus subgen. Circumdati TaxID=2720871 RepID=A0A5N6ZJW5_9EURO|nr:uncharacterized protein BDV27DRAFT_164846 [Aspergillus caelatus]KAE8357099.1 hypothetical protein BDV27DRAFT_164846 [Aspergillus caelatus]KAE8412452.1 hypothetical protein BDV36DRAFT_300868 [Aspergillus pseudocaelatus]
MQISVIAIFTLLGLAAAAPSTSKREQDNYDVGSCNGTSCHANLIDTECGNGSCVGEGGGDGATCHVQKNHGMAFCPVGCDNDQGYCP